MAESAELNILIETGADFYLPYKIIDDAGNPVDLTDATITSHLRRYAESAEYFEFICSHNGTGGRVLLSMPKEVTTMIEFMRGVYDVKVLMANGFTTYNLKGEVTVRHGVTKPIDGTMLYMIGIETYEGLPAVGQSKRIYFVYDKMEFYRWNGENYVLTGMANIKSVEKISTEGLIDTYRMTFDDSRYFDYQITNGRGITNVEKIGESGDYVHGIVDTYRMTFNDGTTEDYEIRNGRVVFAAFDLDAETGHLTMSSPSYYEGPAFELDEDSGHLSVVME